MKKHGLFTPKKDGVYRYASDVERESTIDENVRDAMAARKPNDLYWNRMRRYYDGSHDIRYQTGALSDSTDLPWQPAQCTDGFVHVESQIDASVPGFEFVPRGTYPFALAKKREELCETICDVGELAGKNAVNERRLNIYGSAVWKIGWNGESDNVTLENPSPDQLYPDPTASDVDGCEYVAYIYRMHRQKARRVFRAELTSRGISFEDCLSDAHGGTADAFDGTDPYDDSTVTVTEYWFRQPEDGAAKDTLTGEKLAYAAGDVALSLLINGKEIRYLPRYWQNTGCRMYPFVVYGKIPTDGSLWGKSELEQLIPLIDAADRELTFAQINAAFTSNDVILAEENAFAEGEAPENTPGAIWKLRPGMMGKVQRLGNMGAYQASLFNNYVAWQSMMEQTTGNFEANQGKEPTRVTTASGIALLNERAQTRQSLKKTVKSEGFKRLYRLIDYTALEYYKEGRAIASPGKETYAFRLKDYAVTTEKGSYVPELDVKIHIGDGVSHSKAFTVSVMSALMSAPLNESNYIFAKAYVELLDLPMRKEICEYLDGLYGKKSVDEAWKALEEKLLSAETEVPSADTGA